jgi:hypothetical protein
VNVGWNIKLLCILPFQKADSEKDRLGRNRKLCDICLSVMKARKALENVYISAIVTMNLAGNCQQFSIVGEE